MRATIAERSSLAFHERLEGRFDGMIRLADLSKLGDAVASHDGWYVLEPKLPFPEEPVAGEVASSHLQELVNEILREERGVWTTMVYVQSIEDPCIIKVFHPRRAGCGCGGGGGILPWKVFTRFKPEPVPAWESTSCAVSTGGHKASWFQKLF
ncbi:MAG: hypothetical protein H7834_15210 [Magnetococcus sp. YQC-9]